MVLDKQKVKKLLRKQGFTQKELANELDVSANTVSEWLGGSSQPTQAHLVSLAEFLEVEPEELTRQFPIFTIGDDNKNLSFNVFGENPTIVNIYPDSGSVEQIKKDGDKQTVILKLDSKIAESLELIGKGDVASLINEIIEKYVNPT